jgi:hypothetical protein
MFVSIAYDDVEKPRSVQRSSVASIPNAAPSRFAAEGDDARARQVESQASPPGTFSPYFAQKFARY